MIIISTLIALFGIYVMQDNGLLTQNRLKKISSSLLLLLSCVLLSIEYGTLKGIFIFIGLVSMLGTLVTLLLFKMQSTFKRN